MKFWFLRNWLLIMSGKRIFGICPVALGTSVYSHRGWSEQHSLEGGCERHLPWTQPCVWLLLPPLPGLEPGAQAGTSVWARPPSLTLHIKAWTALTCVHGTCHFWFLEMTALLGKGDLELGFHSLFLGNAGLWMCWLPSSPQVISSVWRWVLVGFSSSWLLTHHSATQRDTWLLERQKPALTGGCLISQTSTGVKGRKFSVLWHQTQHLPLLRGNFKPYLSQQETLSSQGLVSEETFGLNIVLKMEEEPWRSLCRVRPDAQWGAGEPERMRNSMAHRRLQTIQRFFFFYHLLPFRDF